MEKILVTGATGFVGTKLCEALQNRKIPFVKAIRRGAESNCFEIGDISAGTNWTPALSGCDTVIHLAARVHVMKDKERDPQAAFRISNVDATMNLARQAVSSGIKRLVFVSSVKVNGEETTNKPFSAFDPPLPADLYGHSKLEAEVGLRKLALETGLEVVIVRPPLVYGPGVRANFRALMRIVKLGLPLPLGAVQNRRSLVAIDNLVDLLVVCGGHPDAPGHTFMVSDDYDLSTAELVHMLGEAMERRPVLLSVPPSVISLGASALGRSSAARRLLGSLQVDIAHTRSTLGWAPIVGTRDAINQTVKRFLIEN